MRSVLNKIGSLLFALSALALLLSHAALTHGCGGKTSGAEPQMPDGPSPAAPDAAPSRAGESTADTESSAGAFKYDDYMGATKAPPLDAFRGSPKSAVEDDSTPPPRQGTEQQQAR